MNTTVPRGRFGDYYVSLLGRLGEASNRSRRPGLEGLAAWGDTFMQMRNEQTMDTAAAKSIAVDTFIAVKRHSDEVRSARKEQRHQHRKDLAQGIYKVGAGIASGIGKTGAFLLRGAYGLARGLAKFAIQYTPVLVNAYIHTSAHNARRRAASAAGGRGGPIPRGRPYRGPVPPVITVFPSPTAGTPSPGPAPSPATPPSPAGTPSAASPAPGAAPHSTSIIPIVTSTSSLVPASSLTGTVYTGTIPSHTYLASLAQRQVYVDAMTGKSEARLSALASAPVLGSMEDIAFTNIPQAQLEDIAQDSKGALFADPNMRQLLHSDMSSDELYELAGIYKLKYEQSEREGKNVSMGRALYLWENVYGKAFEIAYDEQKKHASGNLSFQAMYQRMGELW